MSTQWHLKFQQIDKSIRQCHKGDIVPLVHQVLHKCWLEYARITVIELEEGADEFMVSEQYNDDNDVKNENNNTTTAGSVSTL